MLPIKVIAETFIKILHFIISAYVKFSKNSVIHTHIIKETDIWSKQSLQNFHEAVQISSC